MAIVREDRMIKTVKNDTTPRRPSTRKLLSFHLFMRISGPSGLHVRTDISVRSSHELVSEKRCQQGLFSTPVENLTQT